MRVEPHTVGSVMHVIKRGTRGTDIVRDDNDKWRFVKSLFYLNEEHQDRNWIRHIIGLPIFERPSDWPEKKTLVSILAWTLMPNHFHLLLYETSEGGISKFMQRLCGSMSTYYNEKYVQKGSLFQGAYKGRAISEQSDLNYVFSYITAKNTLELYPGGLKKAIDTFDKAWEWAGKYKFSSLKDAINKTNSPLLDSNILGELNLPPYNFKKSAQDMVGAYTDRQADLNHIKADELQLEDW